MKAPQNARFAQLTGSSTDPLISAHSGVRRPIVITARR